LDLYANRDYRRLHGGRGLSYFRITEGQTDLHIGAHGDFTRLARQEALRCRSVIERYIAASQIFLTSLEPVAILPGADPIILKMAEAAQLAGVGPMAAVAGAIAEYVGRAIGKFSSEVLVENGGDVYLKNVQPRTVALVAGTSPISGRVGLKIRPGEWGIATSSGTVGHSLSFGCADSATVISHDAALADAVATAMGNRVKSADDLQQAVEWACSIEGVLGAVAVLGDKLGACGQIELAPIEGGAQA